MRIIAAADGSAVERFLAKNRSGRDGAFDARVRRIIDAVRTEGDKAVVRFARRFDRATPPLEVSRRERDRAAATVPASVRRALALTAESIARVAFQQIPKHFDIRTAPGVTVEQRVEPLARVGCYVPGGRFPLPSSLLMTAVPARVAGVREIVVICPKPDPVVMAAAVEAGISRLFRIGGAHGIAALAYGTDTVPRVAKIVGPGSRYVAAAKKIVAADCAIDFYAGPTEIVIVAGGGRPEWIAADLVAQAEHDPDARSIFITWRRPLANHVARAVAIRAARHRPARQSLTSNGVILVVRDAKHAMDLANRLAPEHLVVDRESLISEPVTAGAVFVGPYSAQAAGDYATGSNHVLPTAGAARFRGGLSAADFVRVMSVQRLTRGGLARIAPTITTLARAEGLVAHAESIEIRLTRPPSTTNQAH
ncbi:MAG TPA: histidinol dehydrogenase [Vicinamibacterales bacterium]|jgi:histidinol dehydrogenase